jgi:osmotically-inducible protein OsmY
VVRAIWMCLSSSMFGVLAMYFFDRERGRRRRHMLRDRLTARARRSGRSIRHLWRGAAAETYGVSRRVVHLAPRTTDVVDDETLCQRVESQLFRDRHVPKGDMNINCEHGTVILRGEVNNIAEIGDLEERVWRIPGVRGVQNMLHTRGTPAPNKERSLEARN